jgi:putative MATE family efflux protein
LNLTADPVPQLLKKIAIPASIGMLFNTMYYLVDNFYAGMLSSTALAGLSLAAPIIFMGVAVSIGIGQGTNALIGNALGENNQHQAEKYGGHALSFAWMSALLIGLGLYFLLPYIFVLMSASGDYTNEAVKYLSIMLPTLGFMAHGMAANGILNSQGDTTSLRNSLIVAFFANILLDPLFIFVFDWGVYGLAAATATTQFGSTLYLTMKVKQSKLTGSLSLKSLMPSWSFYKDLIKQSVPASTNMFFIAIGSLIITAAVARFGEDAVAGLGIALRIEQLILLPTIGINIAVLSLVSVNFGAKQHARVQQATRTSINVGTSMMVVGGIILFTFAEPLVALFTSNESVIAIGVSYLRVEAIILPAYVLSFVAGAALQGMKRPLIPMYFNVMRQIILPIAFLAIALYLVEPKLIGVWLSIAVATWLSASLQYVHMRKQIGKLN